MVRPVACILQRQQLDALEAKASGLTGSADNHMINGTKLLNVAGMTRGRRDGILKSEKTRHVVKIGPMHLKGVWYEIQWQFGTLLGADEKKDPVRSSSGLCEQGKDYRVTIPTVCP